MCNSFKVTYTVTGKSYADENKGEEMTLTFDVSVGFSHNPDTYGNGYYMGVEGKAEPFGVSCYDIRYDKDFDPENKIPYIVSFYANKYSGKKGAWKLTAISVTEA